MPHCGEHLPEEKSLGGDSSHYRLHGGRQSASATVAVGTSDAATISMRRDDRREGFSNRRRRNDQRGDPATRRTRRDRSGGSRRAKDDEKTAAARNGTETRRDQLVTPRRRTSETDDDAAARRRRQRIPQCGMPDGNHSKTPVRLAFPTVDENTLDHRIPDGDSATAVDVGELGTDESENNEQHARSHSMVSPAQQIPR